MANTRLLCKNRAIGVMSNRSGSVMSNLGGDNVVPVGMICGNATGSSTRMRTIVGTTGGSTGYMNVVA